MHLKSLGIMKLTPRLTQRLSVILFTALQAISFGASADGAIASIDGHAAEVNGVSYGHATKSAAKKRALSECKKAANTKGIKGKCKVIVSGNGPGYLSIAYGDDGAGYAYAGSAQQAIDAAANLCAKSYKNCQTENIKYWADNYEPRPTAGAKNCRPKTSRIRCSSQCTNGDCIVSYENGCKMRVQVKPAFNPFNHQWEYPSPSC